MSRKALLLQEVYLYLCSLSAVLVVLLAEGCQILTLLIASLYLPGRAPKLIYLTLVVILLSSGTIPAGRYAPFEADSLLEGTLVEGSLVSDGVCIGSEEQLLSVRILSVQVPSSMIVSFGSFGVLEVTIGHESWLYRSQQVELELFGDSASYGRLLGVHDAQESLERLRASVLDTLFARLERLDPQSEAFVGRLLLGHRKDPSLPVGLLLDRCGAAHLSALSGLHLMIICSFFLLLLSPLGTGRVTSCILFVLLIIYYLLVGPRPSLFRALCMSSTPLIYSILGRPRGLHGLRLLCFSLALYRGVTAEPVGMGLVLSYCATAAILRDALPLSRMLPSMIPRAVRMAVCVALSCLCWTAGLLAAYTSRVYLIAPVATLCITPLVMLLMYLSMTLLLLPFQLALLPDLIRLLRLAIEQVARRLSFFPILYLRSFDVPVACIIVIQVTIRMLLGCGMIVLRTRKGEALWRARSTTIHQQRSRSCSRSMDLP